MSGIGSRGRGPGDLTPPVFVGVVTPRVPTFFGAVLQRSDPSAQCLAMLPRNVFGARPLGMNLVGVIRVRILMRLGPALLML